MRADYVFILAEQNKKWNRNVFDSISYIVENE